MLDAAFDHLAAATRAYDSSAVYSSPASLAHTTTQYHSCLEAFFGAIPQYPASSSEGLLLREESSRIMDVLERLGKAEGSALTVQRLVRGTRSRAPARAMRRARLASRAAHRILTDDGGRRFTGAECILLHWNLLPSHNLRMSDVIAALHRAFHCEEPSGGWGGWGEDDADTGEGECEESAGERAGGRAGEDGGGSTGGQSPPPHPVHSRPCSRHATPLHPAHPLTQRQRANVLGFFRTLGRSPYWSRLRQRAGDFDAFQTFVDRIDSARDKLVVRPSGYLRVSSPDPQRGASMVYELGRSTLFSSVTAAMHTVPLATGGAGVASSDSPPSEGARERWAARGCVSASAVSSAVSSAAAAGGATATAFAPRGAPISYLHGGGGGGGGDARVTDPTNLLAWFGQVERFADQVCWVIKRTNDEERKNQEETEMMTRTSLASFQTTTPLLQ